MLGAHPRKIVPGADRSRRRSRLTAVLLLLLGACLLLPGASLAFTASPIVLDGDFADWGPALADPANSVFDPTGDFGNSNYDLTVVAASWDASSVHLYYRRASNTGGAAVKYVAFVDVDGDAVMESTDMVMVYAFAGGNAYSRGDLYWYRPVAGGGDAMSDTARPPGDWNVAVTPLPPNPFSAAGAPPSGIEIEACLSWGAIGVPAESPVRLQYGTMQGNSLVDFTAVHSLIDRRLAVEPEQSMSSSADTTLTFPHTVYNQGNTTETVVVSAVSAREWPTQVRLASDASTVTTVTIPPRGSVDIVALEYIPAGTTSGTKDELTVRATSGADSSVSGAVLDHVFVGWLTISPDRTASITSSSTVLLRHVLRNNTTSSVTCDLSANSNRGWPWEFRLAGSSTPATSIVLPATESTAVVLAVSVPPGTSLGSQDLVTLNAVSAVDPAVFARAFDTVTIDTSLSVTPDGSSRAGAGTTVSYQHVVRNSTDDTMTISLSATSTQDWTTRLYDSDGSTLVTTLTIGPFGASRRIYARLTIPSTAASSAVDTMTIRAVSGALVATATDITTISKLVTYANAGFTDPAASFLAGRTVYARAMGLSGPTVRFRWIDASSTVVFTSPLVSVDVKGVSSSHYSLSETATVGDWRCALLDSAGVTITVTSFKVLAPFTLSLTVDRSSLDFGVLDPGSPSAKVPVLVTVVSNVGYSITRDITGDVVEMGLTVTGSAFGVKPAGSGLFLDDYQILIPWSTIPGVGMRANVVYTVVQ